MATTTGNALVRDAFTLLGVFAPSETIPADDAIYGLSVLNDLVDGWIVEELTIPFVLREVFTVTANQQTYTYGPSGEFNSTRPTRLSGAGLLLAGSTPEIEIPRAVLTEDGWEALQIKTLPNLLWTSVYYNPTYAGETGTLSLWPIPTTGANSCVCYRPSPVAGFAALATTYDLPPGATKALKYNLAVELAGPYGQPPTPALAMLAPKSLASFKRSNYKLTDLPVDPALTTMHGVGRGGYNILTGTGGGA